MTDQKLEKFKIFKGREGPVVLIIMDGIGLGKNNEYNAFYLANTPFLNSLQEDLPKKKLYTQLKAHGTAVGLPTDAEMGNSEVGHNALGSGTVVKQRAVLAKEAIESKQLFKSEKWKKLINNINTKNKKLHFIGLLSNGYVHSHISHLIGLLHGAKDSNIKKVRVHPLLDGRDVPPQSANLYLNQLEKELKLINDSGKYDYRIASGGGRMRVTMDRYNSDWEVVRRGWDAHVCGIPDIYEGYNGYFNSSLEAINQARMLNPEISDQYLPSFVVVDDDNKTPIGKMEDGDGVIYFNFRGDRAIQISEAFDKNNFSDFIKKCNPEVDYYGLLQYDEELGIPESFFIGSPKIDITIVDYLKVLKIPMFAVSETFKIGHLCYFYWGNRDLTTHTNKIEKGSYSIRASKTKTNEDIIEIISFKSEEIEANPKMKAFEIKEELKNALISEKYKFLRVNFTNGDMVGHTGNIESAKIAAETVDKCVEEIVRIVNHLNGITVITADHGNLDDMSAEWKTSHTLNPVMFAIVDPIYKGEYFINDKLKNPQLGNVAATILNLLGYEKPSGFMDSLINFV